MKKALVKDSFKQITNTFKRFLSIALMALLGVGFFAGIKASAPDMEKSMDQYYDIHNVFDIQILSTLGFTEDDIKYISEIEGVESVVGLHDKDAIMVNQNSQYVTKVIELNKQNSPELITGSWPTNNNECVVEEKILEDLKKSLGDTVILDDDSYINKELKIVGTVKSPLYISNQKGSSQLGAGVIEYYLYTLKDNLDIDVYTSMYVNVNGARELNSFSNKFENTVNNVKNRIETISDEQAQKRYEALITEATQKVDDAQKELDNEKAKAEKEISKAEKKLKDNETKLNKAQQELNANKEKADKEFAEAEKQIKQAEEQLKAQIENITVQNPIIQEQINQAKQEIEKNKQELKIRKETTYKSLNNAQTEITNGKKEIEKGKVTLQNKKQEFEDKIKDAQKELDEAKEKIKDIENPEWFVMDREEANSGFASFKQDANSISNIGKVFPIVFFLVATLISLTSMTRMVDEQRTEIGLLQALGYNKFHICSKYFLYSSLATIIGSVIGVTVCMNILPRIIWYMYESVYSNLPNIIVEFNTYYAILGTAIAAACIVGATLYAVLRKLKHMPAVLMIPKAPKPGKRVLLERIPFIWKKLSFSHKVTVRNIFRYKKRFLMTIIGICGCTALIVAGFGLKDTVSSILPTQYGEIYKYDMIISIKETITDEAKSELISNINSKDEIESILPVNMKSVVIANGENEKEAQVITSNTENISEFITLRYSKTGEEYLLNKVIITEKLAKSLDIKIGDTITIGEAVAEVGGITENYIGHYVYVNNANIKSNVILVKTTDLDKKQENELAKTLLEDYRVTSVTQVATTVNMLDNTMSGLNYIVLILIGAAGLLAIVVLYNLANVNISERIRELATIKVLGFYDREVYQYVARETFILTIIGILLGLVAGYFLNYFLIAATEPDYMMFKMVVKPMSYVLAIVITVIFTIIVNIFSYFSLKKISMVESLKSVE